MQKSKTALFVGVAVALLLGGVIVVVGQRYQVTRDTVVVNTELVALSYEREVRSVQLELQSSAQTFTEQRQVVETFLLTVRVPKEKLEQHLAATIAVRGMAMEAVSTEQLLALLEGLL